MNRNVRVDRARPRRPTANFRRGPFVGARETRARTLYGLAGIPFVRSRDCHLPALHDRTIPLAKHSNHSREHIENILRNFKGTRENIVRIQVIIVLDKRWRLEHVVVCCCSLSIGAIVHDCDGQRAGTNGSGSDNPVN